MDFPECPECRAIGRELEQARRTAAQNATRPATPQEIAIWLQRLDDEECRQVRETSDLWKAWRRWLRHRALTGHRVDLLPVARGGLSHPN